MTQTITETEMKKQSTKQYMVLGVYKCTEKDWNNKM